MRFVRDGVLRVPWGYVAGVQCDPIEKKPFFHAHPGALAYSFGMLGCDLHCWYCQNWVTSQALRDPAAVRRRVDADTGRAGCRRAAARARGWSSPPTTSRSSPANGASRSSRRRVRPASRRRSYRTATARPRVLDFVRPVDRFLQGRPEVVRRSPLPSARRPPRADSIHDPTAARDGRMGRDRDAADPGVQRRAATNWRADRVHCLGLDRHSVARDRLPQGLPDERSGEHDAGDAGATPPRSRAAPAFAMSTPGISPARSAISRTRAATSARRSWSSAMGI